MKIEQVANGYIVSDFDVLGTREVYRTLEEVLAEVLMCFECRGEEFKGHLYGRVVIDRTPPAGASDE